MNKQLISTAIFLAFSIPAHAQDLPTIDTLPKVTSSPQCANLYPIGAIRKNAEGFDIVEFVVGADGSVQNPHVYQSSGDVFLDIVSVACVSNMQFEPAKKTGTPTAVDWAVRLNWCLQSDCTSKFPPAKIPPQVAELKARVRGDTANNIPTP